MTFDPGYSLSKIVYQVNDEPKQILWMPSEVKKVSESMLKRGFSRGTDPVTNAWIRTSVDPSPVAVGFLAKNNFGMARIDLPKYQQAVYKILAAIGAIVAERKERTINLKLGVLLPYSEMGNGDDLELALKDVLKEFYFREKKIKVKMSDFEFVPEGYGLLMLALRQRGELWFNNSEVTVLMFGHRNSSCLNFKKGVLVKKHSATSDIGFARFSDWLIEQRPGLKADSIAKKLTELALIYLDRTPEKMEFKATSSQVQFLAKEAGYRGSRDYQLLADAIVAVRNDYWDLLSEWLESVIPLSSTDLIVAGGASILFREKITRHAFGSKKSNIMFLTRWLEKIALDFDFSGLTRLQKSTLIYRSLDVVGYWVDYAGIDLKEAV